MYSLTHLSDQTLLRDLAGLVARDRATTAELLAHLAEVEARKLYLPAAHPSLFSYCVHELHLSEDSARKRIHAARTAREFPAILPALADGRLHLSAVILLAPHLKPGNVDELLAAATHKSKVEIERLLAERFPRPEAPPLIQVVAEPVTPVGDQRAPGRVDLTIPGQIEPPSPPPRVAQLSPQRFSLQFGIGRDTHDKLRRAQELLSHQVPAGDLAEVFDRALDALLAQLKKRKLGATDRPRAPRAVSSGRCVPAHVRRAVWERDQGQCTFVSESGQRCPSRTQLEYDHVEPVARGGTASVAGIRLRCRAHNQYEAERVFGVGFMESKRAAAREMQEARRNQEAERKRERAAAERTAAERAAAEREAAERARQRQAEEAKRRAAKERAEEVIPYLRALGIKATHAAQAAELCVAIPDAPLEQRVRLALSRFGRGTTIPAPAVRGSYGIRIGVPGPIGHPAA